MVGEDRQTDRQWLTYIKTDGQTVVDVALKPKAAAHIANTLVPLTTHKVQIPIKRSSKTCGIHKHF